MFLHWIMKGNPSLMLVTGNDSYVSPIICYAATVRFVIKNFIVNRQPYAFGSFRPCFPS